MSAHFVAWHTVFDPKMPKMGLFWAKIMFLDRKSFFWMHPPKLFVASWLDTRTTTFLCWQLCMGSFQAAAMANLGPFLTSKSVFFYATPTWPPFFGLGYNQLDLTISSPNPEVTFETFRSSVDVRLTVWQAIFGSERPKWPFLGPKMMVLGLLPNFSRHKPKTLPEAQRTQKLTPILGLNLATTWRHLHQLQIWPPDGATWLFLTR